MDEGLKYLVDVNWVHSNTEEKVCPHLTAFVELFGFLFRFASFRFVCVNKVAVICIGAQCTNLVNLSVRQA